MLGASEFESYRRDNETGEKLSEDERKTYSGVSYRKRMAEKMAKRQQKGK